MSYVFVTIFIIILLRFYSVRVFQSVLTYILFSCISFSTQDPYTWSMLRAFHLPNEGSPWQTRVMEWGGEKASSKNSKRDEKTFFLGSSYPVCWHELKAHCPTITKKKGKFTDTEGEKKAREVPQASGRSKCLANRWSYCSSLWDFRNPSEKKKWCRSRYIDDVVFMLVSSLESDIWRSFNFKWGREACPELPCHCRSGWVHNPCCSTRCPSRGSGRGLG